MYIALLLQKKNVYCINDILYPPCSYHYCIQTQNLGFHFFNFELFIYLCEEKINKYEEKR